MHTECGETVHTFNTCKAPDLDSKAALHNKLEKWTEEHVLIQRLSLFFWLGECAESSFIETSAGSTGGKGLYAKDFLEDIRLLT